MQVKKCSCSKFKIYIIFKSMLNIHAKCWVCSSKKWYLMHFRHTVKLASMQEYSFYDDTSPHTLHCSLVANTRHMHQLSPNQTVTDLLRPAFVVSSLSTGFSAGQTREVAGVSQHMNGWQSAKLDIKKINKKINYLSKRLMDNTSAQDNQAFVWKISWQYLGFRNKVA